MIRFSLWWGSVSARSHRVAPKLRGPDDRLPRPKSNPGGVVRGFLELLSLSLAMTVLTSALVSCSLVHQEAALLDPRPSCRGAWGAEPLRCGLAGAELGHGLALNEGSGLGPWFSSHPVPRANLAGLKCRFRGTRFILPFLGSRSVDECGRGPVTYFGHIRPGVVGGIRIVSLVLAIAAFIDSGRPISFNPRAGTRK